MTISGVFTLPPQPSTKLEEHRFSRFHVTSFTQMIAGYNWKYMAQIPYNSYVRYVRWLYFYIFYPFFITYPRVSPQELPFFKGFLGRHGNYIPLSLLLPKSEPLKPWTITGTWLKSVATSTGPTLASATCCLGQGGYPPRIGMVIPPLIGILIMGI